jgi:predicted N-acetyltransferase YhbS
LIDSAAARSYRRAAMPTLVPLAAVDPQLVEDLLDAAFGPDRHARTAYRIRTGTAWLPALSFAALDDDEFLAGTIQLWPVALTDREGRAHPLLMVGPVAVLPHLQAAGYGKALMAAALAEADAGGALPQMLIGDEDYYGRWGFTAAPTGGWRCPGPWDPARLLVRCANPAVLPAEGMLGPWLEPVAGGLAN